MIIILNRSRGLRILCCANRSPTPKSMQQLKTESTEVSSKKTDRSISKPKLYKAPETMLEEEDIPLSRRMSADKTPKSRSKTSNRDFVAISETTSSSQDFQTVSTTSSTIQSSEEALQHTHASMILHRDSSNAQAGSNNMLPGIRARRHNASSVESSIAVPATVNDNISAQTSYPLNSSLEESGVSGITTTGGETRTAPNLSYLTSRVPRLSSIADESSPEEGLRERELTPPYSSPSTSCPESLFYVDEKLERAKSKALRILQYGALSSWEIQQRLQERHFVEEGTASEVASWLQKMGLQSDAEVCEVWVRSRWNQQKKAPSIIKQELKRKRIAEDIIQAALHSFFGEDLQIKGRELSDAHDMNQEARLHDSPGGQLLDLGESGSQVLAGALLETLQRRLRAMPEGTSRDAKRRRIASWLQRRGHGWDLISTSFRVLQI